MEVNTLAAIDLQGADLVLLDLDNTLYEYDRCHHHALNVLSAELAAHYHISTEQAAAIYKTCRNRVNNQNLGTASSHSRLFYVQGVVEKLSGFTDSELVNKFHRIYWDNYINHMVLYDDAIPFLEVCDDKGVPVILVTDMLCEIQFEKIKKLKLAKYFKFIVTSEEAGVEKPHPFIFELAISKALAAQMPVSKIAVVGDNVKKDIFASDVYQVDVFHVLRK